MPAGLCRLLNPEDRREKNCTHLVLTDILRGVITGRADS